MALTAQPAYVRVLVLRGGALGDFLVTVPALQAIRQAWPQARVTLAAYPRRI